MTVIKGVVLSARGRTVVRYAGWVIDRIPLRDMARTLPGKAVTGTVTRPDEGMPVEAWIVNGKGDDVVVKGLAIAWTKRAVHLSYFDEHGRQGFAWVWASAVTRI